MAAALPFDGADRVYFEDFDDTALPTTPEEDAIGAGGLVGGGTHPPSVSCVFGSCRLDLDSALSSAGVADSFVQMAPGTLGAASFGVRAALDDFFLSSSGDDSIGRARIQADFSGDAAWVELVHDRQGTDAWQLVLGTSLGASSTIDLPADVAAQLAATETLRLDLYVDRSGHWAVGSLEVTGFPPITTASLNFFAGTDPLVAVRLEGRLETVSATPSLNLESTSFSVYQPGAPPLPQGLQITRIQEIHNQAGYLTDPGSPGTNSGSNVLADGDEFGRGSAHPGDLDGDGVDDLIVGAPGTSAEAGSVYVLFLNADGTVKARQRIGQLEGGLSGGAIAAADRFGEGLHWLGPLSPGGAPFLAVGAPDKPQSGTSGSVLMLQMASDGTVQADHRIADGAGGLPASSLGGLDRFGASIGSPGDLDGDGIPELAVGAPLDDHGGASTDDVGAVWILFLDSSGQVKASPAPVRIASTTAGLAAGDRFGAGVGGLGDLDGVGPSVAALAVGAPGDGGGAGSVTILFLDAAGAVLGDTTIDAGSGDLPPGNPVAGAGFGHRLAAVADVDGDGVRELAVAAPNAVLPPPSGAIQGELWILFLDPAGDVTRSERLPEAGGLLDDIVASRDGFGFPGPLGDLDGNGIDDLVAGAPWDINFSLFSGREGAVYVLFLEEGVCGDGRTATALGEQCDDGNTTGGDGCSDVCIAEFCGDGIVMASLGETCDDGNAIPEDGCSDLCVVEFCGDGVLQAGLGESCDDGNTLSEDGCSDVCIAEMCGDGVLQAGLGEQCDDGNTASEDGCSDVCIAESCGDGVVQAGLGESCDDGNTASEDGCSGLCIAEVCGDGVVQVGLGETCDDGNALSFDGCSSACQPEAVLRVVGSASGGTLDYTISGVTVSISTSSGQSAAQTAAALAAAINADATLGGLGVTATANGDVLVHGAAPTGFDGSESGVALATSMASLLDDLSVIPRTLDFEGLVAGDPVPDASTLEGVTFGYTLGGDTARVTDRFETPSAVNSLARSSADDAFYDGDVLVFDLPRPVLAFGLYVVTSDLAAADEIRLTTLHGTTGNTALPQATTADGGHVYFLGHVAAEPFTQATLEFADDGLTHFVYTLDDLTAAVPTASSWILAGIAVGGQTVGVVVDGVSVQITTLAGESAEQVARALADAINANATLRAQGTAAAAQGGELLTNGTVTSQINTDPGLGGPVAVPGLAPAVLGLLAASLLGTGLHAARRRWPRRRSTHTGARVDRALGRRTE